MLFASEVVEQDIELLAETETLSDTIEVCDEVVTVNHSLTRGWLQDTGDHLDGCGLSCSIMAEKAEDLITIDVE